MALRNEKQTVSAEIYTVDHLDPGTTHVVSPRDP